MKPTVFELKPGEHAVIPAGYLLGYTCSGDAAADNANDCFSSLRSGVSGSGDDPQLMYRSLFLFTGKDR
jgi:hypothetical protein